MSFVKGDERGHTSFFNKKKKFTTRETYNFFSNHFRGILPASVIRGAAMKRLGFPGGTSGEEPACQCERCKRLGFDPWTGRVLWRRAWQPTPVFSSGKSHGQRSLAGHSPWGRKESDTTEHVHTHTLTHTHENTAI